MALFAAVPPCGVISGKSKDKTMTKGSTRVRAGISEVLDGKRKGPRSALLFAGPAIIASIAYMDPGNYATNIQAGAGYGYKLLWVVLLANLIAWPLAWYFTRDWLDGFVYRIDAHAGYFIGAGLLALLIAWITVATHALRAARIHPIEALRYE